MVWGLGFCGWGFQLMGFGACGVGLSGVFGRGSLYKHKGITLGKNGALSRVWMKEGCTERLLVTDIIEINK